jgi:drug/metabolite transporter (DMT)-like permease
MMTIRKLSLSTQGTLLGLLAVASFGLTLPLTRIAVPVFGPTGVSVARAAIGGLGALAVLAVQRAPFPAAADRKDLGVVALTTVIGFPILAALSMGRAPASHGAVVMAIVPLLTALIGSRLSSERLPPRFWAASVVGSASVVGFALHGARLGFASADLLLFAGSLCAAVGYAYGGRLSRRLGGTRVMCWALVACLPLSLPLALFELPAFTVPATPKVWTAMLYLGLVSQLGGFFIWNRALAIGGIAKTSQTQLLQPFVTIAAAAWLAGETVRPELVVFAVFVALSVAIGRSTPTTRLAVVIPSVTPAYDRKPHP